MKRRSFLSTFVKSVCVIGTAGTVTSFKNPVAFADDNQIKLRFAIASDGHYGQPGTPYERFHTEMMTWLTRTHQESKLDFAFFNGDLIHDDITYFADVKKYYEMLPMPYYVSRGNHDRCSAEQWHSVWNKELNYTFESGTTGFVVLDTADEQGNYVCPNIGWTSEALTSLQTKKDVFVFMHITPLKWTDNGIRCRKLNKLFRQTPNLRAIFHGHDHDQDYVKHKGGKPYFFDGHLGGNWGTTYRGFRVVELLQNGSIVCYQVNPEQNTRINSLTLDYRAA